MLSSVKRRKIEQGEDARPEPVKKDKTNRKDKREKKDKIKAPPTASAKSPTPPPTVSAAEVEVQDEQEVVKEVAPKSFKDLVCAPYIRVSSLFNSR